MFVLEIRGLALISIRFHDNLLYIGFDMMAAAAVGGGDGLPNGYFCCEIWSQMNISLFFVCFFDNFKLNYEYSRLLQYEFSFSSHN